MHSNNNIYVLGLPVPQGVYLLQDINILQILLPWKLHELIYTSLFTLVCTSENFMLKVQKASLLPLGPLSFWSPTVLLLSSLFLKKTFWHPHTVILSYLFYFTALLWQKVYNYKSIAASHVRLSFIRAKFMHWSTVITSYYTWSRGKTFSYNAHFLLDRTVEFTGSGAEWSNEMHVSKEDGDMAANLLGQLSCKCHYSFTVLSPHELTMSYLRILYL